VAVIEVLPVVDNAVNFAQQETVPIAYNRNVRERNAETDSRRNSVLSVFLKRKLN